MVDPSRNESEDYKAHSDWNGKIGLKSVLPKNWGLKRTLKGWKMMIFMNDIEKWSHCNGWPTQVKIMKMIRNTKMLLL